MSKRWFLWFTLKSKNIARKTLRNNLETMTWYPRQNLILFQIVRLAYRNLLLVTLVDTSGSRTETHLKELQTKWDKRFRSTPFYEDMDLHIEPVSICTLYHMRTIFWHKIRKGLFLHLLHWLKRSTYRRETKYTAFVLLPDKQTSACVYKTFYANRWK